MEEQAEPIATRFVRELTGELDIRDDEDDIVIEEAGVKLLVDSYSQDHLKGANVDYIESLMGSGFKINNPNVTKSCSCGSSFSTE